MPAAGKSKTKGKKATHYGPRWPLAVAKARLSEIARRAKDEGPQIITSHGQDILEIRPARTGRSHFVPTGTGYDFVLASIPYRAQEGEEEIEFDTSFPVTSRPIDLP